MEFQTELTKQETHYFIDLLNNDYEKMRKEKDNIIDAIKISCRKVTKEITGKKPLTSIKLIRI